jgi:uncharacterized protein YcfL
MLYHLQKFIMKKIIVFLTLAVCVTTISCTDKKQETKKEVIVVPSKPTVKVTSDKPTSISVDNNGVRVETKKLNVSVKQ